MATLDELAILLAGGPSKEALSAANPYTQFQAIPDQIGGLTTQLAVQAPGRFSTRDLMLSALASGLGSGILGGLGEDYNNTLSDRYSKAVLNFGAGTIPTEDGTQLPASLFGEAKAKGKLFRNLAALQDFQAAQENEINTSKIQESARVDIIKKAVELGNISPDQGMALIQKASGVTAGLPAEQEATTLTDAAMQLPKDIRSEGIKEVGVIKEKEKAAQFVDSQFDQAKKIPSLGSKDGLGSLFPASTSSNEMEGITNSLTTFIQQFLGREMSQVERSNFTKLLPDWNDTVDQIEKKKTRFKELMNTFAKSTPILQDRKIVSSNGGISIGPGATQPTPPTGYEFTGKVDSQGRRGIRPISRAPLG